MVIVLKECRRVGSAVIIFGHICALKYKYKVSANTVNVCKLIKWIKSAGVLWFIKINVSH